MDLENQEKKFKRLCPCCGLDPQFESFSVFCDNMQLAEIGEGYVIYFKLIVYIGWVAAILVGINIYKTTVNFMGNFCIPRPDNQQPDTSLSDVKSDPQCFVDWITPHSIANYGVRHIDMPERILMVLYLGLFWGALALFYHWVLKIDEVIDCKNDTPSDFTLLVASFNQITDLPKEHDSDTIKKHFEDNKIFKSGEEIEISKISAAFQVEKHMKFVKEIKEVKKIIRRLQIKELKIQKRLIKEVNRIKAKSVMDDESQKKDGLIKPATKLSPSSSIFTSNFSNSA